MPRESGIAATGPNQGLSGMNTGMGVGGGMGYNAGQTGNAGTMMGMQQAPADINIKTPNLFRTHKLKAEQHTQNSSLMINVVQISRKQRNRCFPKKHEQKDAEIRINLDI